MRNREKALQVVHAHYSDIERTGTLELRTERGRVPSFCVRFRVICPETGTTKQRRLTIGDDPELHNLVRTAILTRVRNQIRANAAKAEAAKQRKQARSEEVAFMADYSASRRQTRIIRRAYRNSVSSGKPFPIALYIEFASLPLRKRPGRPLANRLW